MFNVYVHVFLSIFLSTYCRPLAPVVDSLTHRAQRASARGIGASIGHQAIAQAQAPVMQPQSNADTLEQQQQPPSDAEPIFVQSDEDGGGAPASGSSTFMDQDQLDDVSAMDPSQFTHSFAMRRSSRRRRNAGAGDASTTTTRTGDKGKEREHHRDVTIKQEPGHDMMTIVPPVQITTTVSVEQTFDSAKKKVLLTLPRGNIIKQNRLHPKPRRRHPIFRPTKITVRHVVRWVR